MNNENKLYKNKTYGLWNDIKKNRFMYFLLLPSVVLVILFTYVPFGGVKIAFQEYNIYNPEASQWVGFDNFKEILSSGGMFSAIWNTLSISLLSLVTTFPAGIIFALLLNELKNGIFKKTVQTVSYLPHFLSWISVIGIASGFYAISGYGLPRGFFDAARERGARVIDLSFEEDFLLENADLTEAAVRFLLSVSAFTMMAIPAGP